MHSLDAEFLEKRLAPIEKRIEMLEALVLELRARVPSLPLYDPAPSPAGGPLLSAPPLPDPTWIPILHSVTREDKSFPPPVICRRIISCLRPTRTRRLGST